MLIVYGLVCVVVFVGIHVVSLLSSLCICRLQLLLRDFFFFFVARMSNIVLFEDIFVVEKMDPDGKKFDKGMISDPHCQFNA